MVYKKRRIILKLLVWRDPFKLIIPCYSLLGAQLAVARPSGVNISTSHRDSAPVAPET